jgi:hypothetical protein
MNLEQVESTVEDLASVGESLRMDHQRGGVGKGILEISGGQITLDFVLRGVDEARQIFHSLPSRRRVFN